MNLARSLINSLLSSQPTYICAPCRRLHRHVSAGRVPDPTPFVPDTTTFLTLIGRELSKHAAKFSSCVTISCDQRS